MYIQFNMKMKKDEYEAIKVYCTNGFMNMGPFMVRCALDRIRRNPVEEIPIIVDEPIVPEREQAIAPGFPEKGKVMKDSYPERDQAEASESFDKKMADAVAKRQGMTTQEMQAELDRKRKEKVVKPERPVESAAAVIEKFPGVPKPSPSQPQPKPYPKPDPYAQPMPNYDEESWK